MPEHAQHDGAGTVVSIAPNAPQHLVDMICLNCACGNRGAALFGKTVFDVPRYIAAMMRPAPVVPSAGEL